MARVSARLLERQGELDRLAAAWREARTGRGSAWFIQAEAGGGKTRLMREVIAANNAPVLWGAAEPVSPPEPYLAIRQALPAFAPAPTRAASVAGALDLFADTAGAGPLLVVLDDLHFADEGTVAVVVRLAAACMTRPWLLLAAFRPEEGPDALRVAATELVAQGTATRLALPPLSHEAAAVLIGEVRGAVPDPAEVATIYADGGGNPWFMEALARGNGAVTLARDRIIFRLQRIEALHPGALPLLLALAPSPQPLPHAVVATLAGGDGPTLRATLVAVRDAGLLVEDGAGWRFRHELLRRSLFETLTAAGRRDAHRAVAAALGDEGSAAALAMHYAEAGDGRTVAWARRAAAEARAVDAHVEALAQLERALAFPMPEVERRDVLVLAGREAFDLGRVEDAGRYTEAAAAIPGGSPQARARTHQAAARIALLRGDFAADEAHLAAAEAALAGEPPSAYALSVMVSRLARAATAVEPAQVEAIAARARRVAETVDDPGLPFLLVSLRTVLASFALCTGDPAGFTALEELLRYAEAQAVDPGFAITAIKACYEEATFALCHAEAAALRERFTEGVRRHGLNWTADIAPSHILELVQRGDYAVAHTEEHAAATPTPGSVESAVLTTASVTREVRAGSLDRARALLAASPVYDRFQPRAILGLAALEVASVLPDADLGERAAALYALVEPHHYARPAGVAAVALARAGRAPPPLPDWLAAASPLRVFWQWAAALAGADTAALREVAARLAAMHCPYEAALALADAGEIAAAYRSLNDLGAGEARTRLAAQLRAAGQPVPRRARAADTGVGLTETERDLCRRVAVGATNEQIAAALFLSVRTVESHLTAIYRKTSLRGRAALAAWWVQPERPEE